MPAVWEATSPDLAIVRLHGRNRSTTWARKGTVWHKKTSTPSSPRSRRCSSSAPATTVACRFPQRRLMFCAALASTCGSKKTGEAVSELNRLLKESARIVAALRLTC